eukprot:80548-Alexandrium_andersonii.AAC.1
MCESLALRGRGVFCVAVDDDVESADDWAPACLYPRIARIAEWRIADRSLRVRAFVASDPPRS